MKIIISLATGIAIGAALAAQADTTTVTQQGIKVVTMETGRLRCELWPDQYAALVKEIRSCRRHAK